MKKQGNIEVTMKIEFDYPTTRDNFYDLIEIILLSFDLTQIHYFICFF